MKDFFEGKFGRYLLPGIMLQSVLIGGGYATGREIYEYGAKFGAYGWISGLTIAIGFALLSLLTFELCRIFKTYDYKNFIKLIIGPLWPIFDVMYVILMVFIIAIMAAATGSIVETTLHIPMWVGELVVVLVVGLLNFYGTAIIERFESVGTILLYLGYILFTIIVLINKGGNISQVFATHDTSAYSGKFSIGLAIWTGILYVSYNINSVPMSMFALKRQKKRKETVISGLIAGLMMTIPWFLTYFAMMCFYTDSTVVGAEVATPWSEMIQKVGGGPVLLMIFGVVMGWTLIETSTSCVHALLDRINVSLEEKSKSTMNRPTQGIITVVILLVALLLSQVGVVNLIGAGYTYLAYAYILLYMIPVLTIGIYKIVKYGARPEKLEEIEKAKENA